MAEPTSKPVGLFPPIGSIAADTDNLSASEETNANDGNIADGEDRAVEEIESLCMQCEQQVR